MLNFEVMHLANKSGILAEHVCLMSKNIHREVKIDFYLPRDPAGSSQMNLLLINDGQDMDRMHFVSILEHLYAKPAIEPILFVAIHAGLERRMEYGTSQQLDYKDRGAKAGQYTAFIFDELLPYIREKYASYSFKEKSYAGFSLGGLSAMDIVWNRPGEFAKVGLFSPSLWWRSIDQNDEAYDDDKHRIMHQQVRNGKYAPWLKFFFQCGNMDETKDRNKNGVIDSIDDAKDLIKELVEKGYDPENDIYYLEMPDGHHDVHTWGKAMPEFLKWGWGITNGNKKNE